MQPNLQKIFEEIQDSSLSPSWLAPLREDAYAHFLQKGYPSRQSEDWKYTSSKPLSDCVYRLPRPVAKGNDFAFQSLLIEHAHTLVFLNGVYSTEWSSVSLTGEIQVSPICWDDERQAQTLKDLWQKNSNSSRGTVEHLSRAFSTSGSLVRVKKGAQIKQPIHLLFINQNTDAPLLVSPQNFVVLEELSEAALVETYISHQDGTWTNGTTEIFLEAGAKLHHVQEKILGVDALHTQTTRIRLLCDAQVSTFNLSLGGRLIRSELCGDLAEPGASLRLDGLCLARGTAHIDNNTSVNHLAPHTSSDQVYKSILYDKSRTVFDGKIHIAPQAQQTKAFQLNKNLLLSPDAEVDTRPQLRIDADDVKCSHGATVGRLNQQEMFYLQSRGIASSEAENLLSKAFVRDVVARLSNEKLENRLIHLFETFGNLEQNHASI